MKLREDLTLTEVVPFESIAWTPSPEPKVARKMLERDGAEIARATSFVRYEKNSAFASHTHERGEEYLVLEGVFADEHGSYPAGTYVRNPPGSSHRPFSVDGCIIFVKLRQIASDDTRHCVVRTASSTLLHSFGSERVSLIELAPGASMELDPQLPGVELLVLRGAVTMGRARCEVWAWLRAPRADALLSSEIGAVVWLKQGHFTSEHRHDGD